MPRLCGAAVADAHNTVTPRIWPSRAGIDITRAKGEVVRRAYEDQLGAATLVLHGADDPLIPVAAHDLRRRISGAALEIFPGTGHDLPRGLIGPTMPARCPDPARQRSVADHEDATRAAERDERAIAVARDAARLPAPARDRRDRAVEP